MPPPSPVFWKNIKTKGLLEGVGEEYEDKGLRGREVMDVKEISEVREVKKEGVSAFMTWSPEGRELGRRPGKKWRLRKEPQGVAAQSHHAEITTIMGWLSRE
jgi:hypothetical protein